MVATCLQVVGFVTSFVGWIGIIVTTSTNDWVVTCGYTIPTCRKLDELGSKGLWADCVMATGLYHCKPLVDILILPGKHPARRRCPSPPLPSGGCEGELDETCRGLAARGPSLTPRVPPCRRMRRRRTEPLWASALFSGIWKDRGGHWPSHPEKLMT